MHKLYLSVIQQFILSSILPYHTARCCQLCQRDFCNDGFTWQGTVLPPATEKVSAPLREAQDLPELFVTGGSTEGLQKQNLRSSLKAEVQKYIQRCEMPPFLCGFLTLQTSLLDQGEFLNPRLPIAHQQRHASRSQPGQKSARKSRHAIQCP